MASKRTQNIINIHNDFLKAIVDTGQAEHIVACIPKYHIVVLKNSLAYTATCGVTYHNNCQAYPFTTFPFREFIQ